MHRIDLAILLIYNVGIVAFGCWFVRRNRSSEHFMSAGRSLPGWAVGLSIFGSYVSSISFLANPGKSFSGNWNPFVFALSLPIAAWLSVRYFVPFYRKSDAISAYHHLESRFGGWARTYAVICFLLIQLTRLGTILYLLSLAIQPVLGWDLKTLIIVIGGLVIIYPMLGGTEGVIWTGTLQSLVLVIGPLVCIGVLLANMPEGPSQIFNIASGYSKFSLGSYSLTSSISESTFWVVLAYGFITNLQNFGIDQAYVQRYITAKSDRAARQSVWMGALLYIPIGAMFFFIGTALFGFYKVQPDILPAGIKPDAVFPHFIMTQLPVGLTGLVLAAICAAAMDSNLNCSATLFHCDIYERYFRKSKSEQESLWVLRLSALSFGILSIVAALAMISVKNALDVWWKYAGIFSGGMVGLFLLGLISRRANNAGAKAGTAIGILSILWMTFSPKWNGLPAWLHSPFHDLLIIVIGTILILVVGLVVSFLSSVSKKKHT